MSQAPLVSILVAARDEAHNLPRCLDALIKLDYPRERLEILIGNDGSTDRTGEIAHRYSKSHSHIKVWEIEENLGRARGKANVIAQLAQSAKGSYFLVTDADIRVHPGWVHAMIGACKQDVGIVTGFTLVEMEGIWGRIQCLEWLLALGFIKELADRGVPGTTMGNNMLIRSEAYYSVGGYEKIPFSVTEDYALFREVVKQGWGFAHTDQAGAVAWTNPVPTWQALLRQRKRWLHGALQTQWYFRMVFYLQVLVWPFTMVLLFLRWESAVAFWLLRSIPTYFASPRIIKMKLGHLLPLLPLVDAYIPAIQLTMLIHYYLPGKITWKGRTYDRRTVG